MATYTLTETELDDKVVKEEAQKALGSTDSFFWEGVDWFLDWFRTKVREFFTYHISTLPIVGRWASRIGTTASEFIFTVIKTLFGFLKTVFASQTLWKKAHEAALRAWTQNESNGILAQVYAYGKKMAGYFLEIIKQSFERAIHVHGLEVTSEEKADISGLLDGLLNDS